MAVGDVWSLRIICYGSNQLGEMVLHANSTSSTGTGATPQQIADTVSAQWAALLKPWMSPTYSYRGVTAQRISPPASRTNPINSTSGQGAGSAAAGDLPAQLSGLLTLKSALVGRRGQGRAYVPFPATAMFTGTGALVSAAGLTQLNAMVTALQAAFTPGAGGNTDTLTYCVNSKKYGQAGSIIQALSHNVFATQRRRGAFGKVNAQPF